MPGAVRAGRGRAGWTWLPPSKVQGGPRRAQGLQAPGQLLPSSQGMHGGAGVFCSSRRWGLTVSPRGPSSSIRVPLGALGDGEA